jgi:cobalt-zinc-cadmium efflux system protein
VVLAISTVILVAEVVVGVRWNSLAVLADAGHVFADVVGTAIALAAIWIAVRPATRDRTFGFYRFEILAAVLNAVLLFAISAYVLVEAARRLLTPPEIAAAPMVLVAAAALAGNAVSVWFLRAGEQRSLNLRAAYLEVLNDMFGAGAVLVAGLVIAATGFLRADALASALIGLLIIPRTWRLLREAVDILLEATPHDAVLARPALWSQYSMPVRMRLHQSAVHWTEVTVQAEKMLRESGLDGEARRIVRRCSAMRGLHERSSDIRERSRLDRRYGALAGS